MSPSDPLEAFVELVLSNLKKNGFPANAVAFSQDKLYESASRQGFSFQKVRDRLHDLGVVSELKGDKLVFSQALDEAPDLQSMASKAQSIFERMDPKEREQLMDYAKSMDPDQLKKMQEMFEQLGPDEKRRLWENFAKR